MGQVNQRKGTKVPRAATYPKREGTREQDLKIETERDEKTDQA